MIDGSKCIEVTIYEFIAIVLAWILESIFCHTAFWLTLNNLLHSDYESIRGVLIVI